MSGDLRSPPLSIAYLFTTFPKATETFMQREIVAMKTLGAELRLYSLWGGENEFEGLPVTTFNKWKLLHLFWIIPKVAIMRWDVLRELLYGLWTRRPRSWINFWENMLGAGFAGCFYEAFRRNPPQWIHAAWSGAPATAAYLFWRMNGQRYSTAAHAYDLYEHGGDWWLCEKLRPAAFVHTSTQMGRKTLIDLGIDPAKVHCIRRGLDRLPPLKPLRPQRDPLRIVSVARLVEKKGLHHQLRIYRALRDANFPFEARIVGEGPLEADLERHIWELDLGQHVLLTGALPLRDVWRELQRADVLVHTGIVAASGDRDGLPNVIPEAMAAGTLVVTSPVAATTEAIEDGRTGLVAAVTSVDAWLNAFRRLRDDDVLAEALRSAARGWVEENFDAQRNAAELYARFEAASRS